MTQIKPSNQNYYQERINLAVNYINTNLDQEIKIADLAQVAHFSTFHFQRIYKALQQETPYETLLRLRLEKAVFLLKHRKQLKISSIALECGFPSFENFSRQFKARFNCSPSRFKKDKTLQNSRIYQEVQKDDFYLSIEESRKKTPKVFEVIIEDLVAIPIVFIRAIYGKDGAGLVQKYQALIDWCINHDMNYQGALTRFGMSIDDPDVTPTNKYRYDFAICLNKNLDVSPEGLIELGTIPKASYATVHCIGDIHEVAQGWDFLYKVWLPQSEFVPLHFPAVEEFIKGPEEIGWEQFNVKCRIPVILSSE